MKHAVLCIHWVCNQTDLSKHGFLHWQIEGGESWPKIDGDPGPKPLAKMNNFYLSEEGPQTSGEGSLGTSETLSEPMYPNTLAQSIYFKYKSILSIVFKMFLKEYIDMVMNPRLWLKNWNETPRWCIFYWKFDW